MVEATLETDYLIIGAGAVGMAFADSLLTETDASIVMVDLRPRPGGHWNDAYPFVRLHQPSAFYGLNSAELGAGTIDDSGLNGGYYELASGEEVVDYFDSAMPGRFLPSGRVQFLPESEADFGGNITSRVTGDTLKVRARSTVDATHSKMEIPATHNRHYTVAPDLTCVPVNDLPGLADLYSSFVVIGAGKTGMDACIWLLEHGVNPDDIRWIAPRDAWLLNRSTYQPGKEFFPSSMKCVADQMESIALAATMDDVFLRREALGELRRIDPSVKPTVYHCAVVSDGELELLRRIKQVVRFGHVIRIEADEVCMERGAIPTSTNVLHVDCSATGIPSVRQTKVFEGDRITLQWISLCQPSLSAALIGYVESHFDDEALKNRLCQPMVPPTVPVDWLQMMAIQLANQKEWSRHPEIRQWQAQSRLDPFAALINELRGTDNEGFSHLDRYRQVVPAAAQNLTRLLAE